MSKETPADLLYYKICDRITDAGTDLILLTRAEATLVLDAFDALNFYGDPESYFAIGILPDFPAGEFAWDNACCIDPRGDHDHRPGRRARIVLGDEYWGTERCADQDKWEEKMEKFRT